MLRTIVSEWAAQAEEGETVWAPPGGREMTPDRGTLSVPAGIPTSQGDNLDVQLIGMAQPPPGPRYEEAS
ncbi:hypothetical protein NCG97_01410 [Streptomyces lydicamycinicus]|uniref:Uncharacterized protein n=1 Tax=Streptomyces lydicamycinicus TaxID=1546107 RepID=A0A0P4RCU8_9ACTN|nr:hypothetical protein [Streptomyces lydicamycinicus]URZ99626.1 hypothetical protein NCG97_01410 [Streptomyces lydicamycinicus]GAO10993.1 hypothetical protein TPA0598_07_07170 [Streptomyces lydicamycinicus]